MLLLATVAGCISLTPQQPGYHLKVGVTKGVHAEIMYKVEEEAAQRNLFLEIVEFPDYIEPNMALDGGSIDANSFQPGFYLEYISRDRQLDLTAIAKTIVMPMGIYSKKLKSLDKLQKERL
jgi:D-methionine transport system substrate-binding protein